MDLSKFSTSLAPVNLAERSRVTVSEGFSLEIIRMSKVNQAFNLKVKHFAEKFPDHLVVKDPHKFTQMLFTGEHNTHTVSYVAHVVLNDWYLIDNEGNEESFEPSKAIQLFNTKVGREVFAKVVNAAINETAFRVEWTDDALKN